MKHQEESLLSAYLDGELGQEELGAAKAHLSSCDDCRRELAALRHLKKTLADAPRRAMPPELIAAIEARVGGRPWILPRPWVLFPTAALAGAALAWALWLGPLRAEPERAIPIEALVTAHSRYQAEALVPQTSLVASNYSDADTYGETQDQEAE